MSERKDAKISDDLRYELADAARVAEAANRPRGLVILATVLFVIAGVALIFTLGQRDAAARQYEIQMTRQERVEAIALQFARLDEMERASNPDINEALPDLFSRIERAATDAGLEKPPIPRPNVQPRANANRVTYSYSMRHPELERLLGFVLGAMDLVPGLGVTDVSIKPGPRDWELEVTFVRWERS